MGNTHRSKHFRKDKRNSISERDKAARKVKRRHHKGLREKERRDKKVTAKYDYRGHQSCGRKIRYRSESAANNYIRTHTKDKNLSCYKCSICGGWHLTSHTYDKPYTSNEVGSELTVREVLNAAREAAIEIRRIEEQAQLKRESVGVQGHTYGFHTKNGILDPTRKIDDLILWEQQEIGSEELNQPIEEAVSVVDGISRIADSLSVELVTRYYLQAESWNEIARDLSSKDRNITALCGLSRSEQVNLLIKTMDAAIAQWETIGLAHLKEMGSLVEG